MGTAEPRFGAGGWKAGLAAAPSAAAAAAPAAGRAAAALEGAIAAAAPSPHDFRWTVKAGGCVNTRLHDGQLLRYVGILLGSWLLLRVFSAPIAPRAEAPAPAPHLRLAWSERAVR